MASLAQTQNGSSSPSPVSPNLTPRMSGGLRLITSDEPEFDYHVSSTYPQVAGHRLYPRARNFMAVLSHEGSRQVKASCAVDDSAVAQPPAHYAICVYPQTLHVA